MALKPRQKLLLAAAHELFWKFGFRKVSVEDICNQAGVSRMTFYKYYNDKFALAKATYDMEVEKGMREFEDVLNTPVDSAEKMEMILKLKAESLNDISQEFIRDFYADEKLGLKEYIEQRTIDYWKSIIKLFQFAQEKGDFRRDFNPELLLFLSKQIITTIHDPYLIGLFGSSKAVIMEIARLLTYGIAPNQTKSE